MNRNVFQRRLFVGRMLRDVTKVSKFGPPELGMGEPIAEMEVRGGVGGRNSQCTHFWFIPKTKAWCAAALLKVGSWS